MIIALLVACCCIPAGAQHLDFCGVELTGNIREFPKKMEEKGYDGWYTIEVFGSKQMLTDLETAYRNTYSILRPE